MAVNDIVPQLRTTDMAASIRNYTEELGFTVASEFEGVFTRMPARRQVFHLKLVDEKDPSIPYVDDGGHLLQKRR